MKLIIQIPCLNEEKVLPRTLADLPKNIEGISSIETLVIDDGSNDRTSQIAKEHGVNYIVRLPKTSGLAKAFEAGIDACLKRGADIVVNTDADNQYKGKDISKLVKPIVEKKADVVIGNRNIAKIKHFSFIKKKLQGLGSWIVRKISGTDVVDATTGFRAYSKRALLEMNIISSFSYTLESIIEAGNKNLAIKNVFVDINPPLRKSRLYTNIFQYIILSVSTMLRIYTVYRALRVFMIIGFIVFLGGFSLFARYAYFYLLDLNPAGHLQSLILAAVLSIVGFQIMLFGFIADLISSNRKLIENALIKIKKLEL